MVAPAEGPQTLLLSRSDVVGLMSRLDYLHAVETGFRAAQQGAASAPPPLSLKGSGGVFHAKGASLRLGRQYAALKFNGNFPDNPSGLPTIQGAILLCDADNGVLLAVMDSIEVTLRRTAAATALAARFLARLDSQTVLVCGCGAQGRAQLEALADIMPLHRCLAWDKDAGRAHDFGRDLADRLGLEIAVAASVGEAARESDVILACTTAQQPYLDSSQVRTGTFIAAVGADSPFKNEVHPELMSRALVVVDVLDQCLEMGDLRHAVHAGTMRPSEVHANLGELVTGAKGGRSSSEQITLFDSTGTALQDVAAAAAIYERAVRADNCRAMAFGAT
jgi:ornithine cyclodeaminase/alanine dehydrogenase-like protein (mu-crystallin family)